MSMDLTGITNKNEYYTNHYFSTVFEENTRAKTDAVSEVESITSEKCLLYVAMTRAQKGVYITSYGRPSEFLV